MYLFLYTNTCIFIRFFYDDMTRTGGRYCADFGGCRLEHNRAAGGDFFTSFEQFFRFFSRFCILVVIKNIYQNLNFSKLSGLV